MKKTFIFLVIFIFLFLSNYAGATPDFHKLVSAIGKAENSRSHPYGIMQKYKNTTPKQACLNTVKRAWKDFSKLNKHESEFLPFLAARYAPIGVANDPNNLNKNWLANVKKFYNKK